MITIFICTPMLLVGLILLLAPNMMRRSWLFAVPVAPDFRSTTEARQAVGFFRLAVAIATAAGLAVQLFSRPEPWVMFLPLAVLAAGCVAYYKAHQRIAPFAIDREHERSLDLSALPDRLPRMTWLGFGPLLILALAAVFLRQNWDSIPARFPIHWGIDGTPDAWTSRSVKGVYGPLIFGGELCLWFAAAAFATWFGARRSPMRPDIMGIVIALEYTLAIAFAGLALQPVLEIPFWSAGLFGICIVIPILAFVMRKATKASDPPDITPDRYWKGNVIYYNPDDPVLFVEKRTGFGYTANLANPWSWILFAGLVLVMVTGPLVIT